MGDTMKRTSIQAQAKDLQLAHGARAGQSGLLKRRARLAFLFAPQTCAGEQTCFDLVLFRSHHTSPIPRLVQRLLFWTPRRDLVRFYLVW